MPKKILCFILVFLLSISTVPIAFGGQSGNVKITLPDFKVIMNGQTINNDYSKYPLIVFNDITYFPMTYSGCRYLGLESTWKGNQEGLLVDATGVTAAHNPYTLSARNGRSYTAKVVTLPVTVNGKAVDNSKEQYPLLSFRDITYFPMTWKYGVEEFGWEYNFEREHGLVIKSGNVKLEQTAISKDRPREEEFSAFAGKKSTCVLVKNGYVYYDNNKGEIVQAPLSDPSKTKKMYQLERRSYGDDRLYNMHNLYEENGKAMLYFHSGGAVMGSDHRIELNSDGSIRQIQSSYFDTAAIGDKLFMYWMGHAPGPGNLRMQESDAAETVALGSPDYWYYSLNYSSTALGGVPRFALFGNQLYVRAAKVISGVAGDVKLADTAIYKVNIDTNEVTRVSNAPGSVNLGQIDGDHLYYLSQGNVYKIFLQDGNESFVGKAEGLPESEIKFAIMGGKFYYTKEDKQLYTLGNDATLNPHAELLSMNITGDNQEYLACTFKESADTRYRIMLFDRAGKVVFKTSDCGSNVIVEGNTVYFYNITTENVSSGKI